VLESARRHPGSQIGSEGSMGHRYAVLGAGRQGLAAAYDMGKFGDADEILLIDSDLIAGKAGVERLNDLLKRNVARSIQCDLEKSGEIPALLEGVSAFVSAVPYRLNLRLTEAAIQAGASMTDLGGNTAIVKQQLEFDSEAARAGISIVPDCGMGPGLNISLALYAMSLLDEPREVYIWDGGLPQHPEPPWNYASTFDVAGLTNEYDGNAYFLRGGKVTEVPAFSDLEQIDFPPIGGLEAFVTSGGLSTAPWTFEGKLERLENKTLRYPGHWRQFTAFAELGLLGQEPIKAGAVSVVPREVFHALLKPRITRPEVHDVALMRVKCLGKAGGKEAEAVIELVDYYDEKTGFTAMQRLTGWHASIVAILAAQGKIRRGAIPIEKAVPGAVVVEEARRRGFLIEERVRTSS